MSGFIKNNLEKTKLSNHAVAALSILTRRAKNNIGSFKASDIIEDHQQAYELLTQAILFGDEMLISLTIELNKTLKIAPNLLNALSEYIKHIESQKHSAQFITQSKNTLSALTQYLYDIEFSDMKYRQASDQLISEPNQSDLIFCLNLIRGFHPYWKNAHSQLLESYYASINAPDEKQALIDFWNNLNHAFLTTLEESSLRAYAKAIESINVPEEQIELRTNIAKMILLKQRGYENTPKGYRANIRAIKMNLLNDDLLAYFLSVTREFYTIWQEAQVIHG